MGAPRLTEMDRLVALMGADGLWTVNRVAYVLPGDTATNRAILKASPHVIRRDGADCILYGDAVKALREAACKVARKERVGSRLRRDDS